MITLGNFRRLHLFCVGLCCASREGPRLQAPHFTCPYGLPVTLTTQTHSPPSRDMERVWKPLGEVYWDSESESQVLQRLIGQILKCVLVFFFRLSFIYFIIFLSWDHFIKSIFLIRPEQDNMTNQKKTAGSFYSVKNSGVLNHFTLFALILLVKHYIIVKCTSV